MTAASARPGADHPNVWSGFVQYLEKWRQQIRTHPETGLPLTPRRTAASDEISLERLAFSSGRALRFGMVAFTPLCVALFLFSFVWDYMGVIRSCSVAGINPNANQLYKWSDKYAEQSGNKGHERFALRGELDVQSLQGADRENAIRELLAKAEPGDMIIVDHMGSDVADGGHCRVVVKNDFATGGDLENAQASFDSAVVKSEGVSAFTGEERIWILRPNKPRAEGPAPV